MTPKPKVISDTARALLTAAATRGDYLVQPPKLPIAAARQLVRSLLNAGLVEEVPAPIDDGSFAWRTGEDGGLLMLRATVDGISRVTKADGDPDAVAPTGSAVEPSEEDASSDAGWVLGDTPQPSGHLHDAGNALDGGVAAPANAPTAETLDGTYASPRPVRPGTSGQPPSGCTGPSGRLGQPQRWRPRQRW
jgi:hypothetical protein